MYILLYWRGEKPRSTHRFGRLFLFPHRISDPKPWLRLRSSNIQNWYRNPAICMRQVLYEDSTWPSARKQTNNLPAVERSLKRQRESERVRFACINTQWVVSEMSHESFACNVYFLNVWLAMSICRENCFSFCFSAASLVFTICSARRDLLVCI